MISQPHKFTVFILGHSYYHKRYKLPIVRCNISIEQCLSLLYVFFKTLDMWSFSLSELFIFLRCSPVDFVTCTNIMSVYAQVLELVYFWGVHFVWWKSVIWKYVWCISLHRKIDLKWYLILNNAFAVILINVFCKDGKFLVYHFWGFNFLFVQCRVDVNWIGPCKVYICFGSEFLSRWLRVVGCASVKYVLYSIWWTCEMCRWQKERAILKWMSLCECWFYHEIITTWLF